uniref:DNA 3'-5' helicase n=1 Tax=Strongyloides papillosus TaxID=174720 RepID=A0A0N5B3I9_STREA
MIADEESFLNEYQIILTTPEKCFNEAIRSGLGRLHELGVLNRIIIDEAHMAFHTTLEFRPEYGKIFNLIQKFYNCNVVVASATLPEEGFKGIQTLLNKKGRVVLKGSTFRSNIVIVNINSSDVFEPTNILDSVKRIMDLKKHFYCNERIKGICVASTREATKTVTQLFNSYGIRAIEYHSKIKELSRPEVFKKWQTEDMELLVTCDSNLTGLDPKRCDYIIHYSLPMYISTYIQEIGRLNRDGRIAFALLYTTSEVNKVYKKRSAGKKQDISEANKRLSDIISQCSEASVQRQRIQNLYLKGELDEMEKLMDKFSNNCIHSIMLNYCDNIQLKSCIFNCFTCIKKYADKTLSNLNNEIQDFNSTKIAVINKNDPTVIQKKEKLTLLYKEWYNRANGGNLPPKKAFPELSIEDIFKIRGYNLPGNNKRKADEANINEYVDLP